MGNAETGGHIEPISAPITAPMDAVAKKGKKRSKNQSIPVVENNNTSNDLTDSNKLTEEHASSIVNSDNNASVPVTDPTDDYQNNINRRYVNSNATESDIELLKGMEWENRKAMMSYFKALAVQRGKEIYNDSEYRGGKQFRLKCKGCSNFCIIGRERYSKIIPGVKKRSFQLKVRNSSFDHFTMNEDGTKAPCIIVNSGSSETKSRRSLGITLILLLTSSCYDHSLSRC